jgi:C4-dicarboxylate transporter, DctM subunit
MEVFAFWALLMIAMVFGVQIGFALAVGAFGLIFLFSDGLPATAVLSVMAERMYEVSNTFSLLALPLFFLAGGLMDAGGISLRLVNFAMVFVGWIRGGLSMVVVVAEMFLSGISGSASADAAALGSTMIPALKRRGYSAEFSAALVASAAALGPIIPPSIGMVVYGSMADVSISRLFIGGVLPGVLFGIGLMAICWFIARARDYPTEGHFPSIASIMHAFKEAILPLMAPVIILGGIFTGAFTATESAMVAVVYGFVVSKYIYRTITWKQAYEICYESALGSARVMFIIATAAFVAWILARLQVPQKVADGLLHLSTNKYVVLIIINVLLLLLGCFLEGLAIMIIMVPTLLPVLRTLEVDLVFFGVMLVINLAIGTIHPPVGVSLIVTSSIANVRFEKTIKELIPFLAIMVIMLLALVFFPQIVLWMPDAVFGRN